MPNLAKLGALTTIAWWIMVMVSGIILQSGLHDCTRGVAPCKVLNCKKLQFVPKWNKLLLTASMFHFGTSCDSAFKELLPNLAKTSKKGGRPQEHVCFIIRQGVGRNIVPAHVTGRDAEDVRKCLEIRRLELAQI